MYYLLYNTGSSNGLVLYFHIQKIDLINIKNTLQHTPVTNEQIQSS